MQVDILMSDREKHLEAQEAAAKADPNAGVPALQVRIPLLCIPNHCSCTQSRFIVHHLIEGRS